jgi:hypothetical protein
MDKLNRRKRVGKSPLAGVVQSRGSFVIEANWERAEELRLERLGPSEKDVTLPDDSERPAATLD